MKKKLPSKLKRQSSAFWTMNQFAATGSGQEPDTDVLLPGDLQTDPHAARQEPQYVDRCVLPQHGQQDDHHEFTPRQKQQQHVLRETDRQKNRVALAEACEQASRSVPTEDEQQMDRCESPTLPPALDHYTSTDEDRPNVHHQSPAVDQEAASDSTNSPPGLATERQQRSVTLRLMRLLVNYIVELMCGVEAASAFLGFFSEAISSPQVSTQTDLPKRVKLFMATKRGSIERRCIRAHIYGAFSLPALKVASEQIDGFSLEKNSYTSGRSDLEVLLDEGALAKATWSRAKYDRHVLDDAIRYVLSLENVAFLSWGTNTMNLDGQTHYVPSIQR